MKLTTAGLLLWALGSAVLVAGWNNEAQEAAQSATAASAKIGRIEKELADSRTQYEFLSELQLAIAEIADACRRNNSDLAWIHVKFHAKSPPEGKFGCGVRRKDA
jgi:hypothetical protein